MDQPIVILVGGFLGAGKTTFLATATEALSAQGKRVAVITNDQAANLVDTAVIHDQKTPVEEVSGGCFCCRFDDLLSAMDRLIRQERPDFLLGEPVGSCTDLSATVLQPLKAFYRNRYRLAPFSVLVEPDRVRPLLDPSPTSLPAFPENVLYIYRKQLEEADLIVLNKTDLLAESDRDELENRLRREFHHAKVLSISAKDGSGVDAWLHAVWSSRESGRIVTEVDYDIYADGEAALGWLNAAYLLDGIPARDWRTFCQQLTEDLRDEFRKHDAEIAHLKVHLRSGTSSMVANLTTSMGQPSLRGKVEATSGTARLLLNVRAHLSPAALEDLVKKVVARRASTSLRVATEKLECFAPSRPEPTHRYDVVV